MIKTVPLPLACLLMILLVVVVNISHSASCESNIGSTSNAVAVDMPVATYSIVSTMVTTAIPTATATAMPSATPITTNSVEPTRYSTPVPDNLLASLNDVTMLRRSNLEYLELEVLPHTMGKQDSQTPVPTPTLPKATPIPVVLYTPQPPALVGKAIVVDQDAQVLHVYENGVQVRTLPASTGVPPLFTPAFLGHVGHYVSTFYGYGGLADNAWYVFTAKGNIYVHGAPYTVSEGTRMYEGLEFLGVRPSSHGCIRLHPADAEWLTAWNPQGVPILITPLDLSREW